MSKCLKNCKLACEIVITIPMNKLFDYIRTHYVSRFWILLIDTVASVLSTLFVFSLLNNYAQEFIIDYTYLEFAVFTFVASVISFLVFKTYYGVVRFTTMREMWRAFFAASLKGVLMFGFIAAISAIFNIYMPVLNILLACVLDSMLTLLLLIVLRVFISNIYVIIMASGPLRKDVVNVLIYGYNDDSVSAFNYLEKSRVGKYRCVGFVNMEKGKGPKELCGKKVYNVSSEKDFAKIALIRNISALIFPTNVMASKEKDRLIPYAVHRQIQVMVNPAMHQFGEARLNQPKEVKIEDLLGRDEIHINEFVIKQFFTDKVVVVTGGAGSIGGQLCRILADMPIRKLILMDTAETPMHSMQLELRNRSPRVEKKFVMVDVRDRERLDFLFAKYRPNIVFHAAAYKHVPMMESNPIEAVTTNVKGSMNMVDCAVKYNVEKFIMISTDKAVNPTNVMGASKRIAETYVQTTGEEIVAGRIKGRTKFITTRFGNVLGSNGSVIPLFKEQIAKGGPITVTDPRITRYFMTIPEACRLVLEAATMGQGSDIFVFDMGEPVLINDLAKRMIMLSGLELGKDIDIEYVGLRPGEKLYEELLKNEENTLPTEHDRIFRAKVREYNYEDLLGKLNRLLEVAATMKKDDTVAHMKNIVPEYISENSRYARLDGGGI